jgi:hypothetical protein
VMAAVTGVSERRVCRVLSVPRSRVMVRAKTISRAGSAPTLTRDDSGLLKRMAELVVLHPTFGYRRLWAILRYRDRIVVNRKVVYRIVKEQGWFVHQRSLTARSQLVLGCKVCAVERRRATSDGPWT